MSFACLMSAACWWFIESSSLLFPLPAAFSVLIPNSCQLEQQSLSKLYPPPTDYARDGRTVFDPHCWLVFWLSLSPGSPGDPGCQQSWLPCQGTAGQALPVKGPAALAPCQAPALQGAAGWCCALAASWACPEVPPGSPACGCPGPFPINPLSSCLPPLT